MFRTIRIFILLLILAGVAFTSWKYKTRSVEWKQALPVNLYLINADGSRKTADYLNSIKVADFRGLDGFLREEAARYGISDRTMLDMRLRGEIIDMPPPPPKEANMLQAILWSLRMRWWSYRNAAIKGAEPQVKLYLMYFDPVKHPQLGHSAGLQKGLIGLVNLFASADMSEQNSVVIMHELLHTLGATDKYDPFSNFPVLPDGFAEPALQPLYPQKFAEIMGGRIPVSAEKAEIPERLGEVRLGRKTAAEINWTANINR